MAGISSMLSCLPLGVYVIGTDDGKNGNLMTAAWLTQVSGGDDPRIAVSISEKHITNDYARASKRFSVSVLTEDQGDVARACGFHSGKNTDKTALVSCRRNDSGLPVIDGAAAYFDCVVESVLKAGDHSLFIAKVVDGSRDESKAALIYNAKEYFG